MSIQFEEDYEDIKTNPNKMWFKYYPQIYKHITFISFKQNIPIEELITPTYEKFRIACMDYDPYRNSSFIPFNKYITTIIHYHINGYIQWQRYKYNRECPTIEETNIIYNDKDYYKDINNKMLIEQIYSISNELQKNIIELYLNNYLQREIADILNVTQSCVSQNLKKIRNKFNKLL